MGRREYVSEDVADESDYDREQVTQHVYDFLGRQIAVKKGVSDNTHAWAAGAGGNKPTMNTVMESFYDDPDSDSTPEQGAGDGNLEWTKSWYGTGGSDFNNTEYRYDWRNRRCLTIPPAGPYTLVKYDHLNRVTATGSYSATTNLDPGDDPATTENGNRLDLAKTYYDEWGRVYKTEVYDDPGDATPADALISNRYYDRRGLVWASDPPNSGIAFTQYDGARRRTVVMQGTQFDSAKYTSDAPDYPDDDEGIVQKTEFTLDSDGHATQIVSKELNHDDTNGMSSSGFIRTYTYNYYDGAHRLTDTANFGTNNSDGWKDNSSAPTYDQDGGTAGDQPPARSDTILVTSYTYNTDGRQEKVTDPKAVETLSVFDDLGRVKSKEEANGTGDERITDYAYNGQGSLVTITANMTVDQVTGYVYADANDSRRVTTIKYPDPSTGAASSSSDDQVTMTYNLDGTMATRTDQNGTVLTWSYDSLRRKTEEEVTTLGSYTGGPAAVDGAVRAVTWQYDSEGRVEFCTTHSDTTPDTTSAYADAVNQIKYTYNAADRLTKEEQESGGKVVDGSKEIEYGYGTDYSTGNYNRLNYVEYGDDRKVWNGYTHSGGANTLQDTTNDTFCRVGQICRDNSGAKGDILAEYDLNGLGRFVRRNHEEDSGKYGNDTRADLWHGTTGDYDGLDRFGRIVDMKFTNFVSSPTDFERRKYGYDRASNRTYIEHTNYKADSQSFSYDNLHRLTEAKTGILDSGNAVTASDVKETFGMDLLGNFTSGAGGIKLNSASSTMTHAVNATNEITTLDRPNPAGAASVINDAFASTLASFWTASKGSWSTTGGEVNVDSLTGSDGVLIASPSLDIHNYTVKVKFPSSSSTKKAGLVLCHDGTNSYLAVVLNPGHDAGPGAGRVAARPLGLRPTRRVQGNRNTGKIALYQVSSGSWGAALADANVTVNDNTSYTLNVVRKQSHIEASVAGQASAVITYDSATEFGTGQSGMYADVVNAKFDDFKAFVACVRDAVVSRSNGLADADLSGSALWVRSTRGGGAVLENFRDDDYVVEVDTDKGAGSYVYSGHATSWQHGYVCPAMQAM